jgi:hypothetical protein
VVASDPGVVVCCGTEVLDVDDGDEPEVMGVGAFSVLDPQVERAITNSSRQAHMIDLTREREVDISMSGLQEHSVCETS